MWGQDQVAYLGDSGDHITELQQRLHESGYAVEVNGNFDQQTQDALNTFGSSQSVTKDSNGEAILALQTTTGALQHQVWEQQLALRPDQTYADTANLQARYRGEQNPGNAVWAGQERDQTYYPDAAVAADEYGVGVQGGRVVIPGEVDANGNPVYLDTVDVAGGVGLVGTKAERMAYTMDSDGELRMADARTEQDLRPGERFHHSSLASGQAVAGAGEMKVREGAVEAVSDRSGHYKPDLAMTTQVGRRLAEDGVDTSRVTFELGNYDDAGAQVRSDTLVSGTELEAYDDDTTLAQAFERLQAECAVMADQRGRGVWGTSWGNLKGLNPAKWQEEYTKYFNELWAPIDQLGERALYREARKMLEEAHQRKRAMLDEIAGVKAWREDPLGRHDLRWYDGRAWTAQVSDGGGSAFIDEESAQIFADDAVVRDDAAARQAAAQAAAAQQAAAQQAAAQQAAAQQAAAQQAAQQGGGYIGGNAGQDADAGYIGS